MTGTLLELGRGRVTEVRLTGNGTAETAAPAPLRSREDVRDFTVDGRPVSISCEELLLDIAKIYPDGCRVDYTYTGDGLPLRTTYASGRWTENVYDARRRLVGTLSSDGANDAVLQRDAYGREMSAANGTAAYAYALDRSGIATNETATIGGENVAIRRELDENGRVTALGVDTNGLTGFVTFGYRPDGRIGSVTNDEVAVAYAYSDDGYDIGYTLAVANGATFVRTLIRDPSRRDLVTAVNNSLGSSFAYSYDALSRPTTRNDDVFAYNARSEVTGATAAGEVEGYTYDNIGNATFAFAGSGEKRGGFLSRR